MHNRRKGKQKTKEKSNDFFMYLRLFLCLVIIVGAFVLKESDSQLLSDISQKVSEELEIERAIEAISKGVEKPSDVLEVFEEKEAEPETEAKPSVEERVGNDFEDFYIGEKSEELQKAQKLLRENQEKLEIETLSYQMSEEELADDTAAEPFKIPPPSYCSYENTKINFKFTSPLRGVITSRYGYRDHPIIDNSSFHTGLDIAAKQGSAIVAFADGKVIESGKNTTYGNYLLVEHADGIRSFYGHNSKLLVREGQNVSVGQKIAQVGSTGMSTGPHLHFEVRKGNIRLDPSYYISAERV